MERVFSSSNMSPNLNGHLEERDELGSLSPETKRRRFNGDQVPVARTMPPRYGAAPVGPGTPFPFGQVQTPHPYPPAVTRRESLPGLRGMVSPPGPMAPPPRPGIGYQQHRLSQGHIPHDRSLTLPPLQTGSISGSSGATAVVARAKSVEEQIVGMNFRYKIGVLAQVAPPAMKDFPRGPVIAVEGDNADAVAELGKWLYDELRKGENLDVSLVSSPDLSGHAGKKAIVQYHLLATEWLSKSDAIVSSIQYKPVAEPVDSAMSDVSPSREPASSSRKLEENYDDSDDSTKSDNGSGQAKDTDQEGIVRQTAASDGKMEVDQRTPTTAKPSSVRTSAALGTKKPVAVVPNFSLHASTTFAVRIPIESNTHYSPSDHWQWAATQWRGVIGPDLTIYVRDAIVGEANKPTVEMLEEGNLFVVKRTRGEEERAALALEPSSLRRLGFEVSEWVRAFGAGEKRGSA